MPKSWKHSELVFGSPNYCFQRSSYQFKETLHNAKLVKQGAEKAPLVPYRKGHTLYRRHLEQQPKSKSPGISVFR